MFVTKHTEYRKNLLRLLVIPYTISKIGIEVLVASAAFNRASTHTTHIHNYSAASNNIIFIIVIHDAVFRSSSSSLMLFSCDAVSLTGYVLCAYIGHVPRSAPPAMHPRAYCIRVSFTFLWAHHYNHLPARRATDICVPKTIRINVYYFTNLLGNSVKFPNFSLQKRMICDD